MTALDPSAFAHHGDHLDERPPDYGFSLDPDPLAVGEDELVERPNLNAAIRRARPRVDSPLADFITGKIDRPEMERRVAERDAREDDMLRAIRRHRPLIGPSIDAHPWRWPRIPWRVVFVALIGVLLGVVIRGMVG